MEPVRLPVVAFAVAFSLCAFVTACGGSAPTRAVVVARPSVPEAAELPSAPPEPPRLPPERWYLEHLAINGRHALLRRVDATGRSTVQTRIVDLDTGSVLEEVNMPELGKFPGATIGMPAKEVAKLDAMLATPRFADDLMRAGHVAHRFPFGTCGRLAASPNTTSVAFNAGDWVYVADGTGRMKKKLVQAAAYDPAFSPDGKYLFFRHASGAKERAFTKYELFVMPADLSQPPRALAGTAGVRERFAATTDATSAVGITSHEPTIRTCVLGVGLRPPFAVKRLACIDGGEPLVESVVSPKGRWAALTTASVAAEARDVLTNPSRAPNDAKAKQRAFHIPRFRLRVVSLATGAVAMDVAAEPGYSLRAISDAGIVVRSGVRGVLVHDVPRKSSKEVQTTVDLGDRAIFRNEHELVFVHDNTVQSVDVRTFE